MDEALFPCLKLYFRQRKFKNKIDYCNFKDTPLAMNQPNLRVSLFVGVFSYAELNCCANLTVTKNQDTCRGCKSQRR